MSFLPGRGRRGTYDKKPLSQTRKEILGEREGRIAFRKNSLRGGPLSLGPSRSFTSFERKLTSPIQATRGEKNIPLGQGFFF